MSGSMGGRCRQRIYQQKKVLSVRDVSMWNGMLFPISHLSLGEDKDGVEQIQTSKTAWKRSAVKYRLNQDKLAL